ncbi:MAG TPA: transglycosylase domain-containing protein [Saprospiraceae bacterium]|nr:transglycosylase domain-containing protein [Saprospiraceae bacterium]
MQRVIDFFLNNSDNTNHKAIVKWMWRLFFAGVIAVILLFVVLSFSNLPSVRQLENPRSEIATRVYAANGEVFGRYYVENRVPVNYSELDSDLVNALVATEDERYYKHSGIDFKALGRTLVKTVLLQDRSAGGASTITQQLAKLLFTGNPGSGVERVVQKLKEWIIAVRLERKYTKEEIISMYLNKFNFINGAYGIKAASETYFSKSQDSLAVAEAAMLVGMLKNPSLYNPLRFPEKTKKRREVVLNQMRKNGLLTQAAYDEYRQLPLGIQSSKRTHIDGIATYMRTELSKDVKDILEEYKKPDGTSYDIYRDGLKIYTTIDPEMQRLAESNMVAHMRTRQETFFQQWKNRDPWTFQPDPEDGVPLSVRQDGLTRLIRQTDRYQLLREKYLLPTIEKISTQVPNLTFHNDDREVERIITEYEQPGHLSRLVQDNLISSSLAANYRRVLKNANFPELRQRWDQLQEAVDQKMNAPTKMRVFTYENNQLEKDTTMTPLDSIKYHRMFLQIGSLGVDPKTGAIKFWVGGINYKYFKYDHIRINRQVGSTFKPFVYATAIDQLGISPCRGVFDWPQTIKPGDGAFYLQEPWTPKNFNGEYSNERLTLFEGLRKSKNTVSVFLMKELGTAEPVRNLVKNMGIDVDARYPNGQLRVPNVPSIALGAVDLSVMEMVGAYTTFANNGIRNKPYLIERIEDKNGTLIYEGTQEEARALPANSNYVMVEMLRQSGAIGRQLFSDAGGKTGTTNDYVDGWFMGITPDLVVGTWVGGDDRWIRYLQSWSGQGSYMAKPFFLSLMKEVEASDQVMNYDKTARFFRPAGPLGIEINCDTYQSDDLDVEGEFDNSEDEEDIFGDEIKEDPFGTGGR